MYAVGMDVKLTTNICPELMLCNGSRGVIVDIIYPDDEGYVPPPRLVQADGEDEVVARLLGVALRTQAHQRWSVS